jgi:PAS domain S-box-containing protein
MEAAPVAAFVKDPDGRYLYANPYLLATMGAHMGPDWQGKTDAQMWPPDAAALMRSHDRAALRVGSPQVFSRVMPGLDGKPRTVLLTQFALPTGDSRIGVGGIGVDITEYAEKWAERDRMAAAIEQATESVMITDIDARITYVNPAFERVTGYRSDEVLGKNPRLLKSGLHKGTFYKAMWAALVRGKSWTASLHNRRKNGSLFTEEAVISPIRNPSGAVTSFVAVKRDVTRERALAKLAASSAQERALIAQTIRGTRAGDTPEATAQAICRRVASFTDVKAARLSLFGLDGRVWPIGFVVTGQPDPPLQRLPAHLSRHLHARAAEGPWIEPWANRPSSAYNDLLGSLGVHAIAYAPVRYEQRLIGLLGVHVKGSVREFAAAEALPTLVEFADLAGALIGRDVEERTEAGRCRDHVSDTISRQAFRPVFQPIVDITHDKIVGYEALTRFTDRANPESMFAEAAAVGLGIELETATLQAALAAAEALPQSAWLNLNASPELIAAGEPLRTLLRGSTRRLVLEVTEHAAIDDYPAFLKAAAALGPEIHLAVDDMGSGFASLRHILELHPAFVKLDRSLVSGLDKDDARQAMIVGLRHFAILSGCRLIAEGVETAGELRMLRSLGVRLAQGYRLGRPKAAPRTSRIL